MSKYTTQVRYICEMAAGLLASAGGSSVDSIVEAAAPHVFDFNFPIYDESYRLVLEKKILKHYYTREIGLETVGLWKLFLETRLGEIMPYYNKLYEAETLMVNPMYEVDLSTTRTKTTTGETTGTNSNSSTSSSTRETDSSETMGEARHGESNSEAESQGDRNDSSSTQSTGTNTSGTSQWNLYSDTPQGGINAMTNDDDSVLKNTYLTNARRVFDEGDASASSSASGASSSHDEGASSEHETSDGTTNRTTTGNDSESYQSQGASSGTRRDVVNSTDEYVERVVGRKGRQSLAKTYLEYRESIINIDMMIIGELEDLFMGIY